MPAPDLIAPDRLEELLGGALPEGEREARLQGLVRELRADAPPVPPVLLERVRALGEEPPRRRMTLRWRRPALALVVALATFAAVTGLIVAGGRGSSGDDDEATSGEPAALEPTRRAAPQPTDAGGASDAEEKAAHKELSAIGATQSPSLERDKSDARFLSARATDVDLWVELRLADADELSEAANESMAITRELGGWVAASDVDTQGREGRAELALRVPVTRVEDAVVRLGELGTVTGQRVETVDLQEAIDRRDTLIESLRRAIRVLELRLETEEATLTPAEELNLRLDLERRRNALSDLRRENRGDRREAATSELTLVLHTREASATKESDEEGVAGAARDALEFLGAAGAIALFIAIVLSPILLVAVLLWLAFRSRSRRQEARLLDRPDPASPSSAPPV